MANPLKTEHAIDWSQTAQEIEDHYQSGMIERDRYRAALDQIRLEDLSAFDCKLVAAKAQGLIL